MPKGAQRAPFVLEIGLQAVDQEPVELLDDDINKAAAVRATNAPPTIKLVFAPPRPVTTGVSCGVRTPLSLDAGDRLPANAGLVIDAATTAASTNFFIALSNIEPVNMSVPTVPHYTIPTVQESPYSRPGRGGVGFISL